MAWRDDVAEVVERLPREFNIDDVYRFVPVLHEKHPENRHIREKIRQQLQILRDEGRILFSDVGGRYFRSDPDARDVIDSLPLAPGQMTNREAVADMIGMRTSDPLRRGMFKPAKGPLQDHLFLFHNERENPYGDIDEGSRVYYVGQGRDGDQQLSSYNKYLAEHLDRGLTVHYFVQPDAKPGQLEYRGEVVVERTERIYRPSEGRSVLVFTLVLDSTNAERRSPLIDYGSSMADILEFDGPPRLLDAPRSQAQAVRLARKAAFRRLVLEAYCYECSVCGEPLRLDQATELQAAHIVGVAERGPDDPRNGISLCIRHHWAFDSGIFSLRDDATILWLASDKDPHGEIIPGERIQLPRYDYQLPHPFFLEKHRSKWAYRAAST